MKHKKFLILIVLQTLFTFGIFLGCLSEKKWIVGISSELRNDAQSLSRRDVIRRLSLGEKVVERKRNKAFDGVMVQVITEQNEIGWVPATVLVEPSKYNEAYVRDIRREGGEVLSKLCSREFQEISGFWKGKESIVRICVGNFIDRVVGTEIKTVVKGTKLIVQYKTHGGEGITEERMETIERIDSSHIKYNDEILTRFNPERGIPDDVRGVWKPKSAAYRIKEVEICQIPIIVRMRELDQDWMDQFSEVFSYKEPPSGSLEPEDRSLHIILKPVHPEDDWQELIYNNERLYIETLTELVRTTCPTM